MASILAEITRAGGAPRVQVYAPGRALPRAPARQQQVQARPRVPVRGAREQAQGGQVNWSQVQQAFANTPEARRKRQQEIEAAQPEPEPEGFWGTGFGKGLGFVINNPVSRVALAPLYALDYGRRAATLGAEALLQPFGVVPEETTERSSWEKLTDPRYGTKELFESTGNEYLDSTLGFIGDVALDPLTYVTGGATKAVRGVEGISRVPAVGGRAARYNELVNLQRTMPEVIAANIPEAERMARRGINTARGPLREALQLEPHAFRFGKAGRAIPGTGPIAKAVAEVGGAGRELFGRLPGMAKVRSTRAPAEILAEWERIGGRGGAMTLPAALESVGWFQDTHHGANAFKGRANIGIYNPSIRDIQKLDDASKSELVRVSQDAATGESLLNRFFKRVRKLYQDMTGRDVESFSGIDPDAYVPNFLTRDSRRWMREHAGDARVRATGFATNNLQEGSGFLEHSRKWVGSGDPAKPNVYKIGDDEMRLVTGTIEEKNAELARIFPEMDAPFYETNPATLMEVYIDSLSQGAGRDIANRAVAEGKSGWAQVVGQTPETADFQAYNEAVQAASQPRNLERIKAGYDPDAVWEPNVPPPEMPPEHPVFAPVKGTKATAEAREVIREKGPVYAKAVHEDVEKLRSQLGTDLEAQRRVMAMPLEADVDVLTQLAAFRGRLRWLEAEQNTLSPLRQQYADELASYMIRTKASRRRMADELVELEQRYTRKIPKEIERHKEKLRRSIRTLQDLETKLRGELGTTGRAIQAEIKGREELLDRPRVRAEAEIIAARSAHRPPHSPERVQWAQEVLAGDRQRLQEWADYSDLQARYDLSEELSAEERKRLADYRGKLGPVADPFREAGKLPKSAYDLDVEQARALDDEYERMVEGTYSVPVEPKTRAAKRLRWTKETKAESIATEEVVIPPEVGAARTVEGPAPVGGVPEGQHPLDYFRLTEEEAVLYNAAEAAGATPEQAWAAAKGQGAPMPPENVLSPAEQILREQLIQRNSQLQEILDLSYTQLEDTTPSSQMFRSMRQDIQSVEREMERNANRIRELEGRMPKAPEAPKAPKAPRRQPRYEVHKAEGGWRIRRQVNKEGAKWEVYRGASKHGGAGTWYDTLEEAKRAVQRTRNAEKAAIPPPPDRVLEGAELELAISANRSQRRAVQARIDKAQPNIRTARQIVEESYKAEQDLAQKIERIRAQHEGQRARTPEATVRPTTEAGQEISPRRIAGYLPGEVRGGVEPHTFLEGGGGMMELPSEELIERRMREMDLPGNPTPIERRRAAIASIVTENRLVSEETALEALRAHEGRVVGAEKLRLQRVIADREARQAELRAAASAEGSQITNVEIPQRVEREYMEEALPKVFEAGDLAREQAENLAAQRARINIIDDRQNDLQSQIERLNRSTVELQNKRDRAAPVLKQLMAGGDPRKPKPIWRMQGIVQNMADAAKVMADNGMMTDDALNIVETQLWDVSDQLAHLGDREITANQVDRMVARAGQKPTAKDPGLAPVMIAGLNDGWRMLYDGMLKEGDIVIRTELYNRMQNIVRIVDNPGKLERALSTYTNFFKTYATLQPGFAVRNGMSAVFMNASDGVGLGTQREGVRLWQQYVKGGEEWLRRQSPEVQQAAIAVLNSGAGGRYLESGVAENINAKTRFGEWIFKNRLTLGMQRLNSRVEGGVRMGMALDSMRSGHSLREATDRVTRIHFDYSQVSKLDKKAKELIPFWTFMSRNLPLQITQMWTKPRMYAWYASLVRNYSQGELPFTPSYWTEAGATNVGAKVGDLPILMAPDLPHLRIPRDVRDIEEFLSGENPGALLSNINPGISVPIEFLTKQDVFTGRKFTEQDYVPVTGVGGAFINPLATMLGQTNEAGQVSENFLNALRSINPLMERSTRLFPELTVGEAASDPTRTAEAWLRSFLGAPIRTLTPKQQQQEFWRRYYDQQDNIDRIRKMYETQFEAQAS